MKCEKSSGSWQNLAALIYRTLDWTLLWSWKDQRIWGQVFLFFLKANECCLYGWSFTNTKSPTCNSQFLLLLSAWSFIYCCALSKFFLSWSSTLSLCCSILCKSGVSEGFMSYLISLGGLCHRVLWRDSSECYDGMMCYTNIEPKATSWARALDDHGKNTSHTFLRFHWVPHFGHQFEGGKKSS